MLYIPDISIHFVPYSNIREYPQLAKEKKQPSLSSQESLLTVLFWLQMSRTAQQSSPEASTGILIEAHVKRRQLLMEVNS